MELEKLYSLLDITTLDSKDDEIKIIGLARQVRRVYESTNEAFVPAAICVFPNWIAQLRDNSLLVPVEFAAVVGGFPLGQTLPQVKMLEAHGAIEKGATELDMVINRGYFLSGRLEDCGLEIKLLKEIAAHRPLKVIIESGELETEQNITGASILALHLGADFVKTSTGKSKVGATPQAVRFICNAIADFYKETGQQRGIKVSGGVATVEEALEYCSIIEDILGSDWLKPSLTRIGASGLANDILIRAGLEKLAEF
jgi:deoxyribose-phosphate aldolase